MSYPVCGQVLFKYIVCMCFNSIGIVSRHDGMHRLLYIQSTLVIWTLSISNTVKILKFGTPQTIAIIVLKIKKFDVTLH